MSDLINTVKPEWSEQAEAQELCRTLMGGTRAMRLKKDKYLPKKGSEDDEEYKRRLDTAYLDNFFQKTIIFYLGQVFKKELSYQESKNLNKPDEPKKPKREFDEAFFERFKEDVDLTGSNLTVFGKRLFQAGLIDGTVFVLTDYVRVETFKDPGTGQLMFKDPADSTWKAKNKAEDERLGLRPYFILIQADQVLDAWIGFENGQMALKHFRYKEVVDEPLDEDGINREPTTHIVAWWPHKWEKWRDGKTGLVMLDNGPNKLGKIPVSWFIPGEAKSGLTARPPLDDLAELNRSYWAASADHEGRLMPYVRSPVYFGKCIDPPQGKDSVPISPAAAIFSHNPGASLESVGVDSGSALNSQADLKEKREAMRDYGLQTVQSGVTATMSENVATNASSSLKGWCADFKDCLENAHKFAAMYQGQTDGPPVFVNMEFKNTLDLNLLAHLSQAVTARIVNPDYYVALLLSMMPYSDEWDVKTVLNENFGKDEGYIPPEFNAADSRPVAPDGAE